MIAHFFENWLFILGPLVVYVVISTFFRVKRDELGPSTDFEDFDGPRSYGLPHRDGRVVKCRWRFSDNKRLGKPG